MVEDYHHVNTVPSFQAKEQTILIEKDKLVVPIIFIPGVMGSNLKSKPINGKSKVIWRLDSSAKLLGWALPHWGAATMRRKELNPGKTEVDYTGKVVDATRKALDYAKKQYEQKKILNSGIDRSSQHRMEDCYKKEIIEIKLANKENKLFGTRTERGWGSVGYISYGQFLEWFQENLFQSNGNLSETLLALAKHPSPTLETGSLDIKQNELDHCKNFLFPVHAMGYNWLASNEASADELKMLVETTLPKYYKKLGKRYEKVILVTHSMGGLVARYYIEALSGADKVLGVVHGVMPATGAAATYTRMKRGTEVYSDKFIHIEEDITEEILGNDALEMTTVCSQAAGPLQLLPAPEYGMGWLTITEPDGKSTSYPKYDPYEEIYFLKDKWWGLCEPHLINPLNKDNNLKRMEEDWNQYEDIMELKVKNFHSTIANKYHKDTFSFYAMDSHNPIRASYLTYEKVHWKGHFTKGKKTQFEKQQKNRHLGDNRRLNLKEIFGKRTLAFDPNDWDEGRMQSYPQKIELAKWHYTNETYQLEKANNNGDGTVPECSGLISYKFIKARLKITAGHEPAYRVSDLAKQFTMRAIVTLLQKVIVNE